VDVDGACRTGGRSCRGQKHVQKTVIEVDMTKSIQNNQQNVSQHGRMILQQRSPDFLDPTHEWRRMFAEMWGTFLLVLVAAGSGVVAVKSGGAVSLSMQVVAPGLMVMAIIYFMGTVSGAHLNPAVTLAFAVRSNFPWRRVPGYMFAQILGGVVAVLFLWSLFGTLGLLGATIPGRGVSSCTALAIEIVLTTGLVNTILGTASGARNIGSNGAIAVGGYIVLAGLWASPISGASMNPARSFASDMVRGDFSSTWIYIVGPILGALIGVAFEWILKGKGTSSGALVAQGSLDIEKETTLSA
jgi:aquaporin Z